MPWTGPWSGAQRVRGERAHRLGVALNALLAIVKIGAGLATGSPALLADGYHSLATDSGRDLGDWMCLSHRGRPDCVDDGRSWPLALWRPPTPSGFFISST